MCWLNYKTKQPLFVCIYKVKNSEIKNETNQLCKHKSESAQIDKLIFAQTQSNYERKLINKIYYQLVILCLKLVFSLILFRLCFVNGGGGGGIHPTDNFTSKLGMAGWTFFCSNHIALGCWHIFLLSVVNGL